MDGTGAIKFGFFGPVPASTNPPPNPRVYVYAVPAAEHR